MLRKTVFLFAALLMYALAHAQSDVSFTTLNAQRIKTDETGMTVLAAWGAANVVAGVAGYVATDDKEWKSFHQMNAIWGVINFGIAGAGYLGAKREALKQYDCADALGRYESTKRLFLLNAGLDGLYITSGLFLTEHAKNETNSPEVWRGYGKSIIVQGVGLLLFDVVVFGSHSKHNKTWYKLLQGTCISGNGVSLNYKF